MEDGRKLRFFFTNGQGHIAANSRLSNTHLLQEVDV
jgi:hypothetical protein